MRGRRNGETPVILCLSFPAERSLLSPLPLPSPVLKVPQSYRIPSRPLISQLLAMSFPELKHQSVLKAKVLYLYHALFLRVYLCWGYLGRKCNTFFDPKAIYIEAYSL